jgi:myosin heavy subunit
VNPFKPISGLYAESKLRDYRSRYPYESPPHVYAIAESAFRNLVNEHQSQAIIITGMYNDVVEDNITDCIFR